MIIEDNREGLEETAVKSLREGDAFLYRGKLHLKIHDDFIDKNSLIDFPIAVINVFDNKINTLTANALVKKVNAKVVIE